MTSSNGNGNNHTPTDEAKEFMEKLEREARDQSDYITLKDGKQAILVFTPMATEFKPDTFNGKETDYKKYWFKAVQLDCTNDKERIFKPNGRSGKDILAKIKVHKIQRIDREGEGNNTNYRATPVFDT